MSKDILWVIGLSLFAAISWYNPLRAYADRTISQTKLIESSWPPLMFSYIVWYMPFEILLFGAFFFASDLGCSITLISAGLWAYIGHNMILASRR